MYAPALRPSAVKNIENAITHVKTIHGYEYLKPAQEEAITSFLLGKDPGGKDVFVSLPTVYGQTVIYELAPTFLQLQMEMRPLTTSRHLL